MQRKKGSKRIEMIIKMVNEFKLTVAHFARPNPIQICACAGIYRWTKRNCGKSGLGHRASGPPGSQAAGPSRALGRGPLGRGPAFSKTPTVVNEETQTEKFDYLFQRPKGYSPPDIGFFDTDDKICFYTSLPTKEILITAFQHG